MNMAIRRTWDTRGLQAHAEKFSARSFQRRIRQVVAEEATLSLPYPSARPALSSRPDSKSLLSATSRKVY